MSEPKERGTISRLAAVASAGAWAGLFILMLALLPDLATWSGWSADGRAAVEVIVVAAGFSLAVGWVYVAGITLLRRGPQRVGVLVDRLHRWSAPAWAAWMLLGGALAWALLQRQHITATIYGAEIVYLADVTDCGPLAVHRIAAARLASASDDAGHGPLAVAPLSEENVGRALERARLLVIASHGKGAVISCRGRMLASTTIERMPRNERLSFVYLTGCGLGEAEQEWKRAFTPAGVHAEDRTTYALEHLAWLWKDAPTAVRGLTPSPSRR